MGFDTVRVYNHANKTFLDVSIDQQRFINELDYGIEMARRRCGFTMDVIDTWKKDKVFWKYIESLLDMKARAGKLTPAYVEDFVVKSLDGEKRTQSQMQAALLASKILGMGSRGGGKVEVTKEKLTISFGEVEQELSLDVQDRPQIEFKDVEGVEIPNPPEKPL